MMLSSIIIVIFLAITMVLVIRKNKIMIVVLLLITLFVFAHKGIRGFFPLPMSIRHLIHSISPPKDLYTPIINDNFLFNVKGFEKSYNLNPKYLDFYELGIWNNEKGIPSDYKFSGSLKLEYFWKEHLLYEEIVTKVKATSYVNNDFNYFKKIVLTRFSIPFNGKFRDGMSLRITVIKPDKNIQKYVGSSNLYIAVSFIP